ncbi:MAG: hypothetical protein A2X86_22380 [Bdellovibrionales bacterium GWA2_49_15]|nr:MAG: hypothetical protein A2X86_22380 [Bdellovibrionales bacterium GWA2_49_15]HAZ14773.1 hypothetical protein [Bdellovibrionales bacterium]
MDSTFPCCGLPPGLILIIEPDQGAADQLVQMLATEGYQSKVAVNCQIGVEIARQAPLPDLVIISTPEVCQKLRRYAVTHEIRILILSDRSEEGQRILGFASGCDDYVARPYSPSELMCRIKTLLRRGRKNAIASTQEIVFGRLRFYPTQNQVWVDNKSVNITTIEMRLLNHLFEHRGIVQSREVLFFAIWANASDVKIRVVDTTIKRLRAKLGKARGYIETVRDLGYKFSATADVTQLKVSS